VAERKGEIQGDMTKMNEVKTPNLLRNPSFGPSSSVIFSSLFTTRMIQNT